MGDAGGRRSTVAPAAALGQVAIVPDLESVYEGIEYPQGDAPNRVAEAYKKIEEGKAEISEAYLFCGRFNLDGQLLRESKDGSPNYRIARVTGTKNFLEAVAHTRNQFEETRKRVEQKENELIEANKLDKTKLWFVKEVSAREDNYSFVSNVDAGSIMAPDPNQYTEYTPFFGANFGRQQYYDQFTALARAFELFNHFPVAKRIITLLTQYALGRGFKVKVNNEAIFDKWDAHAKKTNFYRKIRKYWPVQYLVDGELFIDKIRWQSVDAQSIWDIITSNDSPGGGDDLEDVYYYQQMFQTITQTFSGIKVPGVTGSDKTNVGHYIIRQLPYDQIIHIKTNCYENEKRGRSSLYSTMAWCKHLRDLLFSQVAGENFRSNYIFDDEVDGSQAQVNQHALNYAYMPKPGSIFAHNTKIKRTVLNPLTGNATKNGVAQEILCLIGVSLGIPKDHLNAIIEGAGSRATALVGSEPFTKVIEDLQEDFEDLLYRLAETFCLQNNLPYDEQDWEFIFPSVTKDTTGDALSNLFIAQEAGWISKKRAAIMAAAELEVTQFDYDDEQDDIQTERKDNLNQASAGAGLPGAPPAPPMPPNPPVPPAFGGKGNKKANGSPIRGPGKQQTKDNLNNL